jgi:hypothetical protein
LASLLPVLVPLIPVAVALVCLLILVAATYAAMCPGGYMTGHKPAPEDAAIRQQYEQLADKWNVSECYLVDNEPFGSSRLYPVTFFEKPTCAAGQIPAGLCPAVAMGVDPFNRAVLGIQFWGGENSLRYAGQGCPRPASKLLLHQAY